MSTFLPPKQSEAIQPHHPFNYPSVLPTALTVSNQSINPAPPPPSSKPITGVALQVPAADCQHSTTSGAKHLKRDEHPVGCHHGRPSQANLARNRHPHTHSKLNPLHAKQGPLPNGRGRRYGYHGSPTGPTHPRLEAWFRWFLPIGRMEDRPCRSYRAAQHEPPTT